MTEPRDVTRLLVEWSKGDQEVLDDLLPLVQPELQRLARAYLRRERPDHTLQTDALINEAYLRLVDQDRVEWASRAHFFGICARVMRRVLVDHARKHHAAKRGGAARRITLVEELVAGGERDVELLALDEALRKLEALDPRQGRVVELRFFAGLTIEETGEVVGIAPATVKREWATAKAWLRREMKRSSG